MKRELNDIEVEEVSGGSVTISAPLGLVTFSKLGRGYRFDKSNAKKMRNKLLELYDDNENMDATEFDALVEKTFKDNGWI